MVSGAVDVLNRSGKHSSFADFLIVFMEPWNAGPKGMEAEENHSSTTTNPPHAAEENQFCFSV